MHLLAAVIRNEDLLDEVITAWLDMGITGATVVETTGALQLISQHIPIFAGLRSLTSGGSRHSKTVFTVIEDSELLDSAVNYLEELCRDKGGTGTGIYFVCPVTKFGRLGQQEE
ncbi:MAG: P-II family nitrogen regulator [Desulfosalsimonas sp.]